MEQALKILFLGDQNACRSVMAEGFFRHEGAIGTAVESVGLEAGSVRSDVRQVMAKIGIDVSGHQPRSVAKIAPVPFDVIVTLGAGAQAAVRAGNSDASAFAFVGTPITVHWELPRPPDEDAALEELKRLRDRVGDHVTALLRQGYLEALGATHLNRKRLLDALKDGVVVHDAARRIFLFNRAAERITGLLAQKVQGKHCAQVFAPDGLCGSACPFLEEHDSEPVHRDYKISFTTPKGEAKRLEITHTPIDLGTGRATGVLATIRDVTEIDQLRWQLDQRHSFHGMVGISSAMQDVFETVRQVVSTDYPVLVSGESGTGKELVSNAIHNESRRKDGPFVPINCGALPENILESELFGHVRGAFTGAIRDKKGRFELADKGTIFLDEVGELSPTFQVKLLRVLQEKRIERVGGEHSIDVDVRIISATNRDLRTLVEKGTFREDLYYRLAVVPIALPALRQRREDIPFLVQNILERIRAEAGKEIRGLSAQAMDRLLAHEWPGNVRELINALQFGSVRCEGDVIEQVHLPPEVREAQSALPAAESLSGASVADPAPKRRGKLDPRAVREALAATGGNKVQAARRLGVGRATLYRFLNKTSQTTS